MTALSNVLEGSFIDNNEAVPAAALPASEKPNPVNFFTAASIPVASCPSRLVMLSTCLCNLSILTSPVPLPCPVDVFGLVGTVDADCGAAGRAPAELFPGLPGPWPSSILSASNNSSLVCSAIIFS